jgi:uncharacterized membrane protein
MSNVAEQSHTISMIKAITWRILASVITTLLVLAFTGHLALAAKVGAVDVVVKLIVYFFHERAWIMYGKRKEAKS